VFPAPGAGWLDLQVKHHVVFPGKFQNLFQRGDAFSGKLAPEPRTGIQLAQVRERHVVHRALPVGGAIHRGVVNGHETRIARKLQIRLDERRSQRNGFPERRHGIFRRVSRGPAMRNHQHYAARSVFISIRATKMPLQVSLFQRIPYFLPSVWISC